MQINTKSTTKLSYIQELCAILEKHPNAISYSKNEKTKDINKIDIKP